jgi:glutamine synthetase
MLVVPEADEVVHDALGDHGTEKVMETKSTDYADYNTHVSSWGKQKYLKKF